MKDPRRYGALLRVRQRREDAESLEFAAARGRTERARAERADLEMHQRHVLEAAAEAAISEFNPSRVRELLLYERYLAKRAVEADALILRLESQEAERRRRLDAAITQRRIVEAVVERAARAQSLAHRRIEQRVQDELASIRHALRSRTDR